MSPLDRQAEMHSRAAEAQAFAEATLAAVKRLQIENPGPALRADLKLLASMAEQAVAAMYELRHLIELDNGGK